MAIACPVIIEAADDARNRQSWAISSGSTKRLIDCPATRQAAPPLVQRHVLDERRRPLRPGIVHQHIDATEVGDRVVEPGVDARRIRKIDQGGMSVWEVVLEGSDGGVIDIADVHSGAGREKRGSDRASDPPGGRRHDHPLRHVGNLRRSSATTSHSRRAGHEQGVDTRCTGVELRPSALERQRDQRASGELRRELCAQPVVT